MQPGFETGPGYCSIPHAAPAPSTLLLTLSCLVAGVVGAWGLLLRMCQLLVL
jgi:hypothetical protein